MLCVAYGSGDGLCYSGGADGLVYHWNGSTLACTVDAHKGPVFAMEKVEKVLFFFLFFFVFCVCVSVCVCVCVCVCACVTVYV